MLGRVTPCTGRRLARRCGFLLRHDSILVSKVRSLHTTQCGSFLGDGSRFSSAKKAASYVGITPSTWSSGTMSQPRRAISKEGPAPLRLALFQAAGIPNWQRSTTG
nr:transposase [Mycolicibacillus koreensis]